MGARRRAQAVEAKEASAKGTSGSSSEEILSIHDVPTKASTDVILRPLITNSWEKKSNRKYNQVPQFGKQPKQSVPDHKVLSKEDEPLAQFAAETGLTKAQLEGKEKAPVHEGVGRKPFVLGQPLMCQS